MPQVRQVPSQDHQGWKDEGRKADIYVPWMQKEIRGRYRQAFIFFMVRQFATIDIFIGLSSHYRQIIISFDTICSKDTIRWKANSFHVSKAKCWRMYVELWNWKNLFGYILICPKKLESTTISCYKYSISI